MTTAADELEHIRRLKESHAPGSTSPPRTPSRLATGRCKNTGGIPEYRRRCDEIAAGGYTGFKLA
ncbi:hypothetical protein [Mycobacterium sp. E2479]|uniref:hypothetical protein n=1 Tax=Mycobacterium sp. E2479 TaxID=1834134 RepID=UPI000B2546EF|nr:hypothetical protein [Mycobacterium sp. E2479]